MKHRIPGILLVLMTVASATAQKPIQHIVLEQCETVELSVVDVPGDRYTWDIYRDSTVNFATEKGDMDPVIYFEEGMYEGSTVRLNWLEPGRYFLRVMVWDEVNCTNNLLIFMLDVLDWKPEVVVEGDSVCVGETAVLKLILTGRGPWDVVYTYGDEGIEVNLNGITESEYFVPLPMLPEGRTEFWIMEVTDQCTINTYEIPIKTSIMIYSKPTNSRIYVKEE